MLYTIIFQTKHAYISPVRILLTKCECVLVFHLQAKAQLDNRVKQELYDFKNGQGEYSDMAENEPQV